MNKNPDPKNFTIKKVYVNAPYLIVKIMYHGCTNYDGVKILVYKNISRENLLSAKYLDPHFCENCKISPIARFEPTQNGWDDAVLFVRAKNAT